MKQLVLRRSLICGLVLCASAFAETWSGYLVDAGCYRAARENTSRDGTAPSDQTEKLQLCKPTTSTTQFAVVTRDGGPVYLDQEGNRRAGELVRSVTPSGARGVFVEISGEKVNGHVEVNRVVPIEEPAQ